MKKGILLLTILFMSLSVNVNAQTKLAECEYSNEFKAWLKLSDKDKANTKMPAICKFYYESANINFKGATYTDPSYSLLDDGFVTSVKDQQDTGTCWAHATVASIESNLLKNNLGNKALSSGHLELATQSSLYTPLRTTFNRTFNSGGSSRYLSSPYVLNYWGPIDEVTRYSTNILMDIIKGTSSITANVVEAEKAAYDVNDIAFILNDSCDTNAKNEIKKYIVNHGGITASIYWASLTENFSIDPVELKLKDKFIDGEYYYYNGDTYNIYGGGTEEANAQSNHEVVIIGWDDTISRTNFSPEPATDGAWLIKNSYGTTINDENGNPLLNMGKDGYFWVSYNDINVCTDLAGFYNVDTTLSENIYYYDDLGAPFALESLNPSQTYFANTFENISGKNEIIDRITFAVGQVGLNYTVYYAPNGGITNYEANILAQGTTDHIGYMSIPLDNKKITTEKYSIVVKLSDPNNSKLYFPVSINLPDTIFDDVSITSNVSFISVDGVSWQDTAAPSELQFMNSIRVYTTAENENIEEPPTEEPIDDDTDPKDDDNVNTDDNIDIDLNDDTIIPNNNNSSVNNPQTGISTVNLSLIGSLVIFISGYAVLRKITIFGKI